MRERLAFGILILLLIFLFAFTFAVLGKGEYEPGGAAPATVSSKPGLSAQAGPEASGARSTATCRSSSWGGPSAVRPHHRAHAPWRTPRCEPTPRRTRGPASA